MQQIILNGIELSELLTLIRKAFKEEAATFISDPILSKKPQAPYKDIITIKEAALLIELSVQTIYGLVKKKEIPFFRRPGSRKLRFSRSELDIWVKSDRQKTKKELMHEVNADLILAGDRFKK